MEVRWDARKAITNLKKHGISFTDAELVLWDPNALTFEDSDSEGEQRFVSIGTDSIGRILVVVYSNNGKQIRIVSARNATTREIKQYES